MSSDRTGIAGHLGQLADGMGKLVAHHLQLARLELSEDARNVGKNLARIALYVPLVFAGWLALVAGLAVALAETMPLMFALFLVGALNLGFGVWGIVRASRALKGNGVMADSVQELQSSAAALGDLQKPAGNALEANHAR